VDAILAAGVGRVVAGCLDPSRDAAGGLGRLRDAGVAVALEDRADARAQNRAWRTWAGEGRPYVTLKLAVSLDGRVVVPGRRWVTGPDSRRRVHELRAASDAVAVGMGTVRADAPRLDVRHVPTDRQPRRLAFGRGPLPIGSELELRDGPVADELRALAAEGVQSVLFEGGPTIGASLVADGLVDRLLVFVAPVLAGGGPHALGDLARPVDLQPLSAERLGADVLLESLVTPP
jgi:diaminohydroxyphosphoribosylaminopyrimidine deaminase/5-amino-6-(5-phosphoribosylamino)uracil reductase